RPGIPGQRILAAQPSECGVGIAQPELRKVGREGAVGIRHEIRSSTCDRDRETLPQPGRRAPALRSPSSTREGTELTGAQRIEARDGLAFEMEAGGTARGAWREPDWLGPIGLRVGPGGRAGEPALAGARRFAGEDELGRFEGLELVWDPEPQLAVGTLVRAYRDRPVLVLRLEAEAELSGFPTRGLG